MRLRPEPGRTARRNVRTSQWLFATWSPSMQRKARRSLSSRRGGGSVISTRICTCHARTLRVASTTRMKTADMPSSFRPLPRLSVDHLRPRPQQHVKQRGQQVGLVGGQRTCQHHRLAGHFDRRHDVPQPCMANTGRTDGARPHRPAGQDDAIHPMPASSQPVQVGRNEDPLAYGPSSSITTRNDDIAHERSVLDLDGFRGQRGEPVTPMLVLPLGPVP